MYSQTPSELPKGYSGSAFSSEPERECFSEPEDDGTQAVGALPEKRRAHSPLSFLDRFRIGRYLKGFDLEDLLILALAFLLLLEDGEDDLFPFLLLFLFIQ